MSRPNVLSFIWKNFTESLSRKRFRKTYVGEDFEGNRYYEMRDSKKSVTRGFVPSPESSEVPPPEWMAWLRGLRKLPPTKEEMDALATKNHELSNQIKQSESELELPKVESFTWEDGQSAPRRYPVYEDYEKMKQ